jgi:hypothetical protein
MKIQFIACIIQRVMCTVPLRARDSNSASCERTNPSNSFGGVYHSLSGFHYLKSIHDHRHLI